MNPIQRAIDALMEARQDIENWAWFSTEEIRKQYDLDSMLHRVDADIAELRQALANPVDLAKVGEVGVWGDEMTDLRQAAEQALEALESLDCGDTYKTHNAASALRQALAHEALDRMVAENQRLGLYEDEPVKRDNLSWVEENNNG
jgi:hypothetical protein